MDDRWKLSQARDTFRAIVEQQTTAIVVALASQQPVWATQCVTLVVRGERSCLYKNETVKEVFCNLILAECGETDNGVELPPALYVWQNPLMRRRANLGLYRFMWIM